MKLVVVDGNDWKDLTVVKVFPTVEKELEHAKRSLVIQMNGAKSHVKIARQAECNKDSSFVTVEKQSINSLNLNILNLCSLQFWQKHI